MDALNKLIEAVEAGNAYLADFDSVFNVSPTGTSAIGAYHGSLDAAKALHEALLPGVSVTLTFDSDEAVVTTHYPEFAGAMSSNPARAWLLAILRARAAQSEGAT